MSISLPNIVKLGSGKGIQIGRLLKKDPLAKFDWLARFQTHKLEKSGVIVVSGAGTSDANGDYAIVGTVNGKLFYSNGVCNIFWSGTQWLIAALSPFMGYYSNGSDTPTPAIDEGWSVSPNGTAPAPIVVPQYKPLGLYQDEAGTTPAVDDNNDIRRVNSVLSAVGVNAVEHDSDRNAVLKYENGVPVMASNPRADGFPSLLIAPLVYSGPVTIVSLTKSTDALGGFRRHYALHNTASPDPDYLTVGDYVLSNNNDPFGGQLQWFTGGPDAAGSGPTDDFTNQWVRIVGRGSSSVLNSIFNGEFADHGAGILSDADVTEFQIMGSASVGNGLLGDAIFFGVIRGIISDDDRFVIDAELIKLLPPATPVTPPADVPTLVTAPVVTADNSGSGGSFGIYTCDGGTWDNADSLNYQWNLDGNPISGAGDAIFGATVYQIGHDLTCTVTAINSGGSSLPSTSNDVSARSLGVAWISVSATPGAGSVDNPNDPFFFAQDAYNALVNGGYPSPNVLLFQAGADGGQLDVNLASSVPRLDVYGSVEGFPSACVCTLSVIAYNSSSILKLINIQMSGQVSYTNNSGSTASVDGGKIIGTNASIDNLIVAGTDGMDAIPGGSGDSTGTDGDPGADGEPPSSGGAGQSADSSGGSTGAGTNGNGAVTLLLISDPHSVFSVSNLSAVGGRGGNGGPGANGATAIGGNGGAGGNWNGLPDGNDHFGADGGPGGDAVSNGGDAGAGGNGGDGATITFQDDISFGTVTVNGGAMGFGGAGSLAGSATPGSGGSFGMGIDAVGLPANPGNNGSNGNASAANGNDAPDGTAGVDGSIITI